MLRRLILTLILLVGPMAFAQQEGEDQGQDKDKTKFSSVYGFHTGPLLPNQITGVTEIMPSFGARYGYAIRNGVLELGLLNSNAWGTEYFNASTSYRKDIQLDDLFAIVFGGLDLHYWKPPSSTYQMGFGGHVGGGFTAHLGDLLWFRADMKFNLNPGTALYIGFGFEWRQQGGNDAGAAAEGG